ncbi:MAG: hypothetical protein WBG62_19300 [Cyclobacteriaceae bacterium]
MRNEMGIMIASMDPGRRHAMMLPERLEARRKAQSQQSYIYALEVVLVMDFLYNETQHGGEWNKSNPKEIGVWATQEVGMNHLRDLTIAQGWGHELNIAHMLYSGNDFLFDYNLETGEKYKLGTLEPITFDEIKNGGIPSEKVTCTDNDSYWAATAHGLNLTAVAGGGFTVEIGIIQDNHGNTKFYFSRRLAVGLDAGIGFTQKAII